MLIIVNSSTSNDFQCVYCLHPHSKAEHVEYFCSHVITLLSPTDLCSSNMQFAVYVEFCYILFLFFSVSICHVYRVSLCVCLCVCVLVCECVHIVDTLASLAPSF